MKTLPTSPIIVIGMHRSGTTMVTQVLEQFGVFMGAELSHNAENTLIVQLNDWLLWQGSGAWDNPLPFRDVLDSEPVGAMAVDYLRLILGSPWAVGFVGRANLVRGRTGLRLPEPWGFKDPRTTFTLPLWLQLWPNARVISVTRHGVDVASSLKVRVDQLVAHDRQRYERRRRAYVLRPKHERMKRLSATLRCARLDGGFDLWDAYATEATRHVADLGPRALQMRYEDFLRDPRRHVQALAAFCELPLSADALDRAAAGIDRGRAFAFESLPELREFSSRDHVAGALRRHGYEPSVSSMAAPAPR